MPFGYDNIPADDDYWKFNSGFDSKPVDYSLGSTNQTGYTDDSYYWGNNPSAYTAPSYNNPSAYTAGSTYTPPDLTTYGDSVYDNQNVMNTFDPSSQSFSWGNNPSAYVADLAQSPLNAAISSGAVLPQNTIYQANDAGDTGAISRSDREDEPWWKRMMSKGEFLPNVSPGQANMFKLGAGILEFLQKRQQAKALNQAAARMDPFGSQRPFYQEQLQQTYTDPNAYMNRPEARLQLQALEKALARRDAKSGRRSQYGSRALELAQAQAKLLSDYRSPLAAAAGVNIAPGGAQLLSDAARTKQEAVGAPIQSVLSAITGQDPRYTESERRIAALEKAFLRNRG